jgi:hypothetical protein
VFYERDLRGACRGGRRLKLNTPGIAVSNEQSDIFSQWSGTCRFLYNCALEHRKYSWEKYQINVTFFDQSNELKNIKKMEGFDWF